MFFLKKKQSIEAELINWSSLKFVTALYLKIPFKFGKTSHKVGKNVCNSWWYPKYIHISLTNQ